MGRTLLFGAILTGLIAVGCPAGKYAELADAPAADLAAARARWSAYLAALGERNLEQQPELAAVYFSKALVASLELDDFGKALQAARRRRSTGLFDGVEVTALKQAPDGLVLVIDSKAGEVGIPVSNEDGLIKFAALDAATGEWTREPTRSPASLPAEPSLLYLRMLLADEQAPIGERLRAAVGLSQTRYRPEILRAKKQVRQPIVLLGLALARVKIDGFDEAFLSGFPTDAAGLQALEQADAGVFEEMLVKLTNQGSLVEDPPANEVLYRVAAAVPARLHERLGKALYEMAEANPRRFANAVFSLAKDLNQDPTLAVYFAEVKRRSGQAPNLIQFLKKFSRQGEGPERALCTDLLAQFRKRR